MVTKELSEAAVELNAILENTSEEILKKIPNSFKKFINDIKSEDYKFEYDKNKKLVEQDVKPETRGLIALIYQNYICDEKERAEYIQKCNEYFQEEETKKREKYNPDNIFKTENKVKPIENVTANEVAMVEYKESIFSRFVNKIKSIFIK